MVMKTQTRHQREAGFSLIELLIVVGIILIVAAIAIPNLMRARMSANESSATASIRTISTGEVSYAAAYPTVGFTSLASLGGASPCTPSTGTGCFIDDSLASGSKEGYTFSAAGGTPLNGVNMTYTSLGIPSSLNMTGTRSFCSDETGVIFYAVNSTTCTGTGSVLQ
jgi:type IV pilus assembly protein PilA